MHARFRSLPLSHPPSHALRFLHAGNLEADLPGFFLRIRRACAPGGNPKFSLVQVQKTKVLIGSKLVVGLYVNPGDGNFITMKVSMGNDLPFTAVIYSRTVYGTLECCTAIYYGIILFTVNPSISPL